LILNPADFVIPAGENWNKATLANLHLSEFAIRRNGLMGGRRYNQGETDDGAVRPSQIPMILPEPYGNSPSSSMILPHHDFT
jgi:hypothetical protein